MIPVISGTVSRPSGRTYLATKREKEKRRMFLNILKGFAKKVCLFEINNLFSIKRDLYFTLERASKDITTVLQGAME